MDQIPDARFAISKKSLLPTKWDRRVMSFKDAYGNEIATIEFHIPGKIFPEEFRLKTIFRKQEKCFAKQEEAEELFTKIWREEISQEKRRQENIDRLNNLLIISSKKTSFNF